VKETPPQTSELSIIEMLAYGTVRIEGKDGADFTVTGTGFFLHFRREDGAGPIALITNRHVVSGVKEISFRLSGPPGVGDRYSEVVRCPDGVDWIPHPDPSIDFCCTSFRQILANTKGHLHVTAMERTHLADEALYRSLEGTEDVIMVGYPNGIWDSVNNKPIYRRGIIATHPARDYNGKPEFVIDCACFPGSSGSPVYLHDNRWMMSRGNFALGSHSRCSECYTLGQSIAQKER
jgi:hypothetical protein